MAIAGIILATHPGEVEGVEAVLRQREGVLELRRTPASAVVGGVVAALECPARDLPGELEGLRHLPGVREVHLVFANYEDDLDARGSAPCPPGGAPLQDLRRRGAP